MRILKTFPERERGFALVETLVTIVLLTIAVAGITSVIIMSSRAESQADAGFRDQLDARQVLYDVEKNLGEAKRSDDGGNQPIFQAGALTVPTQSGQWVTYELAEANGQTATIYRFFTATKPASLPLTVGTTAKQMITVTDPSLPTTVGQNGSTPLFTYYNDSGQTIASPVANPRDVRTIRITFSNAVTSGHGNQSSVFSTQIRLRNY